MNLSSKNLQQLLERDDEGIKLSIYIPTNPSSSSQTLAQDITRFKNALKEIKNNSAYDERKLGAVVESLYKLAEDIEFWKQQDVGLALFADTNGYNYYHLPYEITEAVYIKSNFVISPLVIMNSIGTKFYVLDVNLTKPRLLKSNHGTLIMVNEENMPASFKDTIARDEYNADVQQMAAPKGSGGDNSFHGHSPEDTLRHDTARYLTLVADSVNQFLVDQDQPLLLVGDQSRVGNLRPHLTYKHVLSQSIDGNFETHNSQALFDAVVETIQKHKADERHIEIEKLLSSDPKLIISGNKEITQAAHAGRVERIYVPAYRRTADSVQSGESESIILQLPDHINDIESVVKDVLSQSGSVVAIEIGAYPELQKTTALCRFSQ